MSSWDKGAAWAETSKVDIAGKVQKVAFELYKKFKENPKSYTELSLQIPFDQDGFKSRFTYFAKISAGSIEITNTRGLCDIMTPFQESHIYSAECKNSRKCKQEECMSGKHLLELSEYLRQNYNINVAVIAIKFEESKKKEEFSYDNFFKKGREARNKKREMSSF